MRPAFRWCAAAVLMSVALGVGCAPSRPETNDELALADYYVTVRPDPWNYHRRAKARLERGLYPEALADVDTELATYKLGDQQARTNSEVSALVLRSCINDARGDTAAALADLDRILTPPPSGSAGGVMTLYDLTARRATLLIKLHRLGEAEAAAAMLLGQKLHSDEFRTGWKLMREIYAAR